MKKISLFIVLMLTIRLITLANGVVIVDTIGYDYLRLQSSKIDVRVENQVAITTTTQVFTNIYDVLAPLKYGFPLPEKASAVELKWKIDGQWYIANFSPEPQDTSVISDSGDDKVDWKLIDYLGATPLLFDIEQKLKAGENLIVELTYVELLEYKLGEVSYSYPADYRTIQSEAIDIVEFNFLLKSERTIEELNLTSHGVGATSNNGNEAILSSIIYESTGGADYKVVYSLSLDELGLFGLSTYLPDSLIHDDYGRGFFVFIAEPDPSNTEDIIDKVFTLIIDRSGSMSGNKMEQAKNAAKFIVQNLNPGDKFNIIDFSSNVNNFRNEHVEYNNSSETDALAFISDLESGGGTNIAGSFDVAIPQFSVADDGTANIVIFFTDGQATAGITNTNEISNHISGLINQNETELSIFTFGIGGDANKQLLTLLADNNNGVAAFLGNDDLENAITEFYMMIRNPVLKNTKFSFSPSIINEVYPTTFPVLYIGQQMLIVGRYNEPTQLTVTITGETSGEEVSYEYTPQLADSDIESYRFLLKVWAKKKIDYLLVQYYLDPKSTQAEEIKQQIIEISLTYCVISPFTSFQGGSEYDNKDDPGSVVRPDENAIATAIEFEETKLNTPKGFSISNNYPNPFSNSTTINLTVNSNIAETAIFKIYNYQGQLIAIIETEINGRGEYQIIWDGRLNSGTQAPAGLYSYELQLNNEIAYGKMMIVR